MKNLYLDIRRSSETIPFFLVASLLFILLIKVGSGKLKAQASSAILGMFNASALSILFLAFMFVAGSALLICGALTAESSVIKAKAIRFFVERPAAFMINLTLPMIVVTLTLIISFYFLGYRNEIPELLGALFTLIVFALIFIVVVASTRSHLLAKLDKTMAGGRIFGLIVVATSAVVSYWVLLR